MCDRGAHRHRRASTVGHSPASLKQRAPHLRRTVGPNLARIGPTTGRCRSKSAIFCPQTTNLKRCLSRLGQSRPVSAQIGRLRSTLARTQPTSTRTRPTEGDAGRTWPGFGRVSLVVDELWTTSAEFGSALDRIRPSLASFGQHVVNWARDDSPRNASILGALGRRLVFRTSGVHVRWGLRSGAQSSSPPSPRIVSTRCCGDNRMGGQAARKMEARRARWHQGPAARKKHPANAQRSGGPGRERGWRHEEREAARGRRRLRYKQVFPNSAVIGLTLGGSADHLGGAADPLDPPTP